MELGNKIFKKKIKKKIFALFFLSEMMCQNIKIFMFLTIMMVFGVNEGNCLFDWMTGQGGKENVYNYRYYLTHLTEHFKERDKTMMNKINGVEDQWQDVQAEYRRMFSKDSMDNMKKLETMLRRIETMAETSSAMLLETKREILKMQKHIDNREKQWEIMFTRCVNYVFTVFVGLCVIIVVSLNPIFHCKANP